MHLEREFGPRLRHLRLAADLTQEALAEQVGCAAQTVRAFESGRRRPSREMAARMAHILGVPADQRDEFIRLARALPVLSEPASADQPSPSTVTAPAVSPAPPATALIGRQRDLQLLHAALCVEQRRLVTILGPGGAGKTRLAMQVAGDLRAAFRDGAVFVALAPVTDTDDVITAIAAALGCSLGGHADASTALLAYLRERQVLLVLDNLEQLLGPEQGDQVVALMVRILAEAPGVALLVTSRERLRMQAEWVLELGGLAVPAGNQGGRIARSDAVVLFVERARRTIGEFVLGPHNQEAVAQICRRLDGLPLAIELAAAQISFLSPAALLARLDQVLPLLEGGARDMPQRQRTMRATIAWSHDLLQRDERQLFERLGVLMGSWSLEAAEAVGGGDGLRSDQVLPLLRRLADQSLLVRDDGDGEARYRMLEPVRQYAVEMLERAPVAAAAARARHAAFYRALAQAAFDPLRGPEQIQWIGRLEREYANMHAAINWLLTQGDYAAVAHIGYSLWLFLWVRGHFRAGQHWMTQVLGHLPDQPSLERGHARLVAAVLAYGQAEYLVAAPLAEASVEDYQAVGNETGIGYALSMVGLIAAGLQQDERATSFMAEAVAMMRRLGDPSSLWSAAMVLNYWAPIPLRHGNYAEAASLAQQALDLARRLGDRIGAYSALYLLALIGQANRDLQGAWQRFGDALQLALELGDLGNAAACLEGLAGVLAQQGDDLAAVRLFAAAAGVRVSGEVARYAYTQGDAAVAQAVAELRRRVDTPRFEAAWAEGKALTLDEVAALVFERMP